MNLVLFFVVIVITLSSELSSSLDDDNRVKMLLITFCEHSQIVGDWTFSQTTQDKSISVYQDCKPDGNITVAKETTFRLTYPNIVTNLETKTTGTWTMAGNSGFEIRIDNQRFITFWQYRLIWKPPAPYPDVITFCNKTWVGWYSENDAVPPKQWGCFQAFKEENGFSSDEIEDNYNIYSLESGLNDNILYEDRERGYSFAIGKKIEKFRVDGKRRHNEFFKQFHLPANHERYKDLPETFDWRDIGDYVTPVRSQKNCGSCYIFGGLGAVESRIRIDSKLKVKTILSPQDVVNCGWPTNQGCAGGLSFLSTKFGREHGYVEDSCIPYEGKEETCSDSQCHPSPIVSEYGYVGGYYGASNEKEMMYEIYHNGPISGSFLVEDDPFMNYTKGVYTCQKHEKYEADHCIEIIGWTKENNTPAWVIKNSWGSTWGELGGYFLMRKGQNDCNIESDTSYVNTIYKEVFN